MKCPKCGSHIYAFVPLVMKESVSYVEFGCIFCDYRKLSMTELFEDFRKDILKDPCREKKEESR